MAAARAAGVRVIAVTGTHAASPLQAADVVVDSLVRVTATVDSDGALRVVLAP